MKQKVMRPEPENMLPKNQPQRCSGNFESKEHFNSPSKFCTLCGLTADDHKEVIETNALGGKNSKITGRFDLLATKSLTMLAGVYEYGANKYRT